MGTVSAKQIMRSRAARLLGVAAVVAGILSLPLEYTEGVSVSHKLFWVSGGEIHKGDYVVFKKADPLISGDGRAAHLTKKVACMPGELLRFDGKSHWCGSTKLGAVIDKSKDGQIVKPFVWNGPVPQGVAFVEGEHPRSFDSRYFGFVPVTQLTRMVALL